MSSSEEEDDFPSIESVTPQSKIDTIYQSKTEKMQKYFSIGDVTLELQKVAEKVKLTGVEKIVEENVHSPMTKTVETNREILVEEFENFKGIMEIPVVRWTDGGVEAEREWWLRDDLLEALEGEGYFGPALSRLF